MTKRPDYKCPRCGYSSSKKDHMDRHFNTLKVICPIIENDIELTDDVKSYVLTNRVYKDVGTSNSTITNHNCKNHANENKSKIDTLKLEFEFYKNKKSERFYQLLLETYLKGTHKTLDCGITDVTNEECHAEIKEWSCWKDAIGQLLSYNYCDNKEKLRVYFFGSKRPTKTQKNMMNDIFALYNIEQYEFVTNEANGYVQILNSMSEIVYEYHP